MIETIKTKIDLCTGCNRWVRECPMETANITYQDEAGNIKVKVDSEKCISCGRCVSACKHEARYYADDTERFFNDLKNGVSISLIAAPSIRTNIAGYKRLFTYLKRIGVNKIYDVSLGADISIWAHIRYIEKNNAGPIITQPCPVIVSYCKTYRHDLLKWLSPVHGPMACASVYIKKYQGIHDRIAALSPCIAKKNEFEDTHLAQYNVTFIKLLEYLKENNIELPKEETEFDHDESGLGCLFPLPGGLKENIEYLMGKKPHITKAEGFSVYEKLNTYAETSRDFLPEVFDVLNCIEGCNEGPAASHDKNIFEIDKMMDAKRRKVTEERRKDYYESLYKTYDNTFDLSHFTREYKPVSVSFPFITDEDINKAFELLGKTDDKKQNVDCGACGSVSCHSMAKKIALGVNIPINCIVKSTEDAKLEHQDNLLIHKQLADMKIIGKLEAAQLTTSAMFESNPQINVLFDSKFNVINCNPAAVKFMGFKTKDDMLAGAVERIKKYIPLYQSNGRLSISLNDALEAAVKNGYAKFDTELIIGGRKRSLDVEFKRIPYESGHAIVCYTYDMTEIHEREKELMHIREESELQLAKLNMSVKATKIALWEMEVDVDPVNPVNRVTWSDELRHQLGYTDKNDFPNTVGSLQNILHPDDKQKTVEALVNHLSDKTGKTPYDMEYRAQRKNGEYGFYRGTGETIRDKDGNPIRVVGTQMDITGTNKALMENELQLAKLNMAVKATKIGLWDMEIIKDDPVNPKNAFTWSDEFRHMLGYADEKDFPDVFSSWSDRIHPDDKEQIIIAFEKHIMDTTGMTPYDIEYRMFKKDGECGYFRDCGETIRDEHGSPIRVAGALLDVTVTKNILNETEKQRMEAENANKAKSAFLSTMSHEIRTPMNAILGITEILLQNETLVPEFREAIVKINNSGDLLLGIINDILDLSKTEAGKMELIIDKYEISSLISDTAQLNMMHIGSKPIKFSLFVDENIPVSLVGDELRIKQILNNLLSNAFKYTQAGTVKMSVFSEAIAGKDNEVALVFKVGDTGQGMTKAQIAKLFNEYSRFNLETNRSTQGTGLGMSITQKLIHLMNGNISIESEPGKGSVFTVYLPQGKNDSALLGREMAENLRSFRTSSKTQMKRAQISREPMPYGSVLIVDDVETNIFVAKGLLSPYKLKIDSADSGFTAIEKIKQGNVYDIIFMDHMMPKMDGIEATKIIRSMGYRHAIVALTANAVTGQADIFLKNGFDDYISKPIDIRQMNSLLNRLIRDKHPPEVVEAVRKQTIANKEPLTGSAPQPAMDPRTAEIFLRDARKTLTALETASQKNDYANEDTMRAYIISAHGIKGALANIGKKDLSAAAFKLEMAGREGKIETIKSETPAFLDSLRAFAEELTAQIETAASAAEAEGGKLVEDKSHLTKMLHAIKTACQEYDENTANKTLEELRKMPWSPETKGLLGTIAEQLLHSDFDEIAKKIDEFIKTP